MARKHLKRLVAPKSWGILRKEETFITRPNPGPHTLDQSLPISVLLKRLGFVKTSAEAKKALLHNQILIDGRRAVDPKTQAGLFDEVKIGETTYRVLINKLGQLVTPAAPKGECGTKPCKVIGKTAIKGGRTQANTNDGRNVILSESGECSVGDTIMVSIPEQAIKGLHKLETGAFVFLTGGKHLGDSGSVTSIKGNAIAYKNTKGEEYTTLKEYAFVLGKGKPCITLP